MPEGDTIFRAASTLHRALAGKLVTSFESVFPKLNRVDEDSPLAGRGIESVTAKGKWMLMRFSGDLILITHLRMNGRWHIYRPGDRWQRARSEMRVLIATVDFTAVGFNLPVADFHNSASLRRHPALSRLGPDLLDAHFDAAEAVRRLRAHGEQEIGEALLNQSILAGAGNVFKSEICFLCKVFPFRRVALLSENEVESLIAVSRKLLAGNVFDLAGSATHTRLRRTTGNMNREEDLWVYGRRGKPCRICGVPIRSVKQGPDARITFWCPQCQK